MDKKGSDLVVRNIQIRDVLQPQLLGVRHGAAGHANDLVVAQVQRLHGALVDLVGEGFELVVRRVQVF